MISRSSLSNTTTNHTTLCSALCSISLGHYPVVCYTMRAMVVLTLAAAAVPLNAQFGMPPKPKSDPVKGESPVTAAVASARSICDPLPPPALAGRFAITSRGGGSCY